MDAYPPDYVAHNLPFIVLSGLGTRKELEQVPPIQNVLPGRAVTSVSSELPVVIGDRADELLQEFLSADGTNSPWNGRTPTRRGLTHGFRIRTVGRDFQFPPKKADPPTASATSPPGSPTIAATPSWTLHSPISPLSPVSPTYPDGVFTPSWVGKHQHYVPSVFISFFSFTTDPITNSLHDNQLKSEINKIKAQIQKSDYRTRYVVVLLSDKTILESPEIDDRLSTIRRATALDPKTSLFFLPPNTSQVELRAFVTSVLTTLSPICVEYYRDLTKHARRKKGRNTIPAPTAPPTRGTSQTLAQPGWGVRYDFKLGIFAEFRQEMDAAQRHYNIALDSLFATEGLFETTASWSPRWDEIRLIADTITFRHIRCQLWNSSPTSAVQTWLKYRSKLKEVIDRRGKGSSNYGWSAWESRWACVMAQLIQRTELPHLKISQPVAANPQEEDIIAIYLPPEKQFPVGERLPPWELLHHPGYWYKIAADHAKRRYILARDMPEEDRTPPGMSPATKVSNRSQIYDQYLVPEPHMELPLEGISGGFEHWKDIVVKLNAAIIEFEAREQDRKVEQLQLEAARTLLHVKQFEAAFKILKPLWERMSWRKEGWYSLASEVLWGLHECALRVNSAEVYLATEWELHSQVITGKTRYKYDLMTCLNSLDQSKLPDEKVKVSLNLNNYLSCLSVSFTFSEGEGNVGEPLPSQIALTSNARPGSAPITLSKLAFQFKGCLSEVTLSNQPDENASGEKSDLVECELDETTSSDEKPRWSGTASLIIHPGQSKIFAFPITFREAGEVEVVSDSFELSTDKFDLTCTTANLLLEGRPTWWLKSGTQVKSRKLNRDLGTAIKVLPKPPKMEIRLPDIRNQYFTDEFINLSIEILNKEEDDTEAVLEVRLLGRSRDTLGYSWMKPDSSSPLTEVHPTLDGSTDVDLPGHVVGQLAQGAHATERIRFKAPPEPADYALEVKVLYHILSDRDIPISKTMIADLVFNAPFEASYDLTARVHSDPWPSYFELLEAECNGNPESTDAFGIAQMWGLRAKVASFADEPLVIKDMTVAVQNIHGGATCVVSNEFDGVNETLKPQEMGEWSFGLDVRKNNLEERRSTSLDTELRISWQRLCELENPPVTTSLPIPRIQIPSSEPRVLGSIMRSAAVDSVLHLDYTLENPTMHFLTFELNMEASEEFGFSGAKLRTLHLLPMSRQTVRYNLLPLVEGAWMTPNLRVVDRYFNKTLKVQATEGLKQDKLGISVWIPGKDGKGPEEKEESG